MRVNKTMLINTLAIVLIASSFFSLETISKPLLYTGLFALSGALTNQLAIFMLFEKVPFLYGSGVIETRFESFKIAIKNIIMSEFFTKEQLDNFFKTEEQKINLVPVIEATDFSSAYDALTKTVMESSFGGMLGMFGGESALEGLRDPFTNKMRSAIVKIVQSEAFNVQVQHHLSHSSLSDDMMDSIEGMISARLNEMTPQLVKTLVETLIKEHLGWLVLWGGVFGGLIGLVSSFLV